MRGKANLLIISLTFIFIFVIFNLAYVYQHELVHQLIFSYFGVNSTIRVDWWGFGGGETIPDQNETVTCDAFKEMMLLHGLNEIFDYHFLVIFFYFFVSMLFIIAVLIVIMNVLKEVKEECQQKNK